MKNCLERTCLYLCKQSIIIFKVFLSLVFVFVLLIVLYYTVKLFLPIDRNIEYFDSFVYINAEKHELLYFIAITLLTGFILLVAYIKFCNINNSVRINYLLHIEDEWRNKSVIEAKIEIRKIYKSVEENRKKDDTETDIIKKTGEKIIDLYKSTKEGEIKKYVLMKELLDLLETVGYLLNNGYITLKEFYEIFGLMPCTYYQIFEQYIIKRRGVNGNHELYKEFQILNNRLVEYRKSRHCCF